MLSGIMQRLALFDLRGYVIVSSILIVFVISLITTFTVRARYALLSAELSEKAGVVPFESPLLLQIVEQVGELARSTAGHPPNVQAIIEHNFQQRLRGALLGERFVRASVGLVIILGLVGTFYGLSLSIGKLVGLLTADSGTVDITQALTVGLTDTLSGMSVAFTSSLAGVGSAILLTLLGVVLNIASARTGLMLQIETHLERLIANDPAAVPAGAPAGSPIALRDSRALGQALDTFSQSVAQLDGAVTRFEAALTAFASTTRDFREFNHHLKDNVQRMSLSFGDLSEVLRAQATAQTTLRGPRLRGEEQR
jgi:hypothetical protein